MLRIMSEKLWSLMKDKKVSLAMIFDSKGKIFWSRGRKIEGEYRDINNSIGFSRTVVNEVIRKKREIFRNRGSYIASGDILSGTAVQIGLKSILTLPIASDMFVYFDSKEKVFNMNDIEYLRGMVEIFGCAIEELKRREFPEVFLKGNDIKELRDKIIKYAMENESVLITGETGVGKSFIAREIHRLSERRGKFIEFNCSNIPASLFESELFGHKKGAFTGAIMDKKGIVEEAQGGTLFLDEVAEIPLYLQSKLLRFVETKKYRKVGDEKEQKSDIRLIFATNKNLKKEVKAKNFREDLYYRISTFIIHLPPLRERKDMIEYLMNYYAFLLNGKKLNDTAKTILLEHKWDGNIREFIQVFRRAGVEIDKDEIGEDIVFCMKNHITGFNKLLHSLEKSEKNKIIDIIDKLSKGETFWDAVKTPFMNRNLTKEEVSEVIKEILRLANTTKIKDILSFLNLKIEEYKKFLDFLNNHKIKVKIK